jgi:hypothetical protein
LNIQKLKSTRFVLLGGSHLNKIPSKATTTTLLPLLAPTPPSQSLVDAFFNEDDSLPSAEVDPTSSANGIESGTSKFGRLAFELKSTTPIPIGSIQTTTVRHEIAESKPTLPWVSARDIDFLVPKVLIPRGDEWKLEEERAEELGKYLRFFEVTCGDGICVVYGLKAGVLDYSNMPKLAYEVLKWIRKNTKIK